VARRNALAFRVDLLGGQLAPARIPGTEHHGVAERGELPAHLKADATVPASHHGYRQLRARWHRHRPFAQKTLMPHILPPVSRR